MTPIQLSEVYDPLKFGGKAAQLGTAIRAGLPVPNGYGLDAALVDEIVQGEPAARAAVEAACTALTGPLAVRSSAIGEDSAGASFAGQHATLLNVDGIDAVFAAIEDVWRSGRTESAMAYRERVGADSEVHVAVVIQQLIAAEVAGVLFTCNPLTGKDELVIEAGWGLGEAIVQGLIIPDRYRLKRDGDIIEATAGLKETAVRLDPNGATRHEAVAPEIVEQLCLSSTALQQLQELADRCDTAFGSGPHDIEWAMQADAIYLLQRRPVTGSPT